ncbi:MAG TPA: class I SAM-dependent methyltransferase [Ktedonobacterales bacterium]|jgi:ubiquinone/menaquinone biosynthesis C-methylase UbiE
MKWFRRGNQDAGDDNNAQGPHTNARDSEGREFFLPGGVADESVNSEGRGFFILGGSPKTGKFHHVTVDEEGHAFIEVGGRRLMADIPDILPKDEQEINRLDFQHFLLHHALGANYAAPITQPGSILDVGCGTGRWAIELARQFPRANVIGLDIVPPDTLTGSAAEYLPDNYLFTPGNLLDGLPFATASFDVVHMRLLFMAIPANRWSFAVRELVRVTRPGGWIELVEGDLPKNGGPALEALSRWANEGSQHRGIDLHLGAQIGKFLYDARARNIVTQDIKFPVGRYGGRIGQMTSVDAIAMIESLRALVVMQGIATPKQYDQALASARSYISLSQAQCFLPFYLAYGQR